MKRFFRLPTLVALVVGILLVNACTVDEEPFVIGPSITFLSEAGFLDSDATIGGENIRVKLSATQGDNPMQALSFLQDGVAFSNYSRISIDGVEASSSAPLLFDPETEAFTWEVEIAPHTEGTATYTFSVSDASGNTDQVSLDITVEASDPTISFVGMGSTINLLPSTKNQFSITASGEGPDLSTIAIYEDGALISAGMDRIFYGDASTEFTTNPLDLTGDDVSGLMDKPVFIRTQDSGTSVYLIEVTNSAGKMASASVTVQVGTDIDAEFTAVLMANADGPNLGGIDLYNGSNVSALATSATVVDQGINGNPIATNWIQKIAPANGAAMKELTTAQIDAGFTYAGVTYKEDITSAWDNGMSVSESTNQVQVGDVFIINKDNDYFIMSCTKVEVVETNNEDFYEFDIKQAIFQ